MTFAFWEMVVMSMIQAVNPNWFHHYLIAVYLIFVPVFVCVYNFDNMLYGNTLSAFLLNEVSVAHR